MPSNAGFPRGLLGLRPRMPPLPSARFMGGFFSVHLNAQCHPDEFEVYLWDRLPRVAARGLSSLYNATP